MSLETLEQLTELIQAQEAEFASIRKNQETIKKFFTCNEHTIGKMTRNKELMGKYLEKFRDELQQGKKTEKGEEKKASQPMTPPAAPTAAQRSEELKKEEEKKACQPMTPPAAPTTLYEPRRYTVEKKEEKKASQPMTPPAAPTTLYEPRRYTVVEEKKTPNPSAQSNSASSSPSNSQLTLVIYPAKKVEQEKTSEERPILSSSSAQSSLPTSASSSSSTAPLFVYQTKKVEQKKPMEPTKSRMANETSQQVRPQDGGQKTSSPHSEGFGRLNNVKKMKEEISMGALADILVYMYHDINVKPLPRGFGAELLPCVKPEPTEDMKEAIMGLANYGDYASFLKIKKYSEENNGLHFMEHKGFEISVLDGSSGSDLAVLEKMAVRGEPLFLDTESYYHEDQGPSRDPLIGKKGKKSPEKIGLLQIADMENRTVLLVRLHRCNQKALNKVKEILEKIHSKRHLVAFGDGGVVMGLKVMDIQPLNPATGNGLSLKNCAAQYLGEAIQKAERLSDWARDRLSAGQIRYAAVDAILVGQLYEKISA